MMRTLLFIAGLMLLSSLASAVTAGPSPVLQVRDTSALQIGAVEYVLGKPMASFDDAAGAQWPWQPLTRPTLGKQPNGAWLRISLHNSAAHARLWYLLLKWPVLDRVAVRLHYPDSDRWGTAMLAGDAVAMSARPLADHHFVYPLELPAGERAVVYLQVQARETLALPLELIDEKQLIESRLHDAPWSACSSAASW